MGRIKIKDLSKDVKISEEEMKKMTGGGLVVFPYIFMGKGGGGGPSPSPISPSLGETFKGGCSNCVSCHSCKG